MSLGWDDPLEKEMTAHSSTLARRIPWWAAVQGVADLDTTGWGGFIVKKGSCKEEQQIQNLQDRSACWKPWKVLLLQLKSKGSLEADSPAPRGTLDFFL